jgi:hypothetical protein
MKHQDSKRIPDHSLPQWDCLRCGQRMQKWKHAPDWVPPKGKGWFSFWYECLNKDCQTRQVMPKAGFMKPGETPRSGGGGGDRGPDDSERLLAAEEAERLEHFRAI